MTAPAPLHSRFATSIRAGAAIVAAWLAFALLQAGLMRWVEPSGGGWMVAIADYVALAVLWSALTPIVITWHRFVAARTRVVAWRVLMHVPLAIVAAVLEAVVLRATLRATGATLSLPFSATLIYYADLVTVSYVAIVFVAETITAHRVLAHRTRHTARLESQVARARLDYLDAQLQPHFLFNSLGAVSELAFESPSAAKRMLANITSLFRFALSTETDEITLGQELRALEPYLDIQRVRFADWLTIEQHVEERATACLVPRLVLQPLVENAVRHGLSGRTSPGTIAIHASVNDDRLVVRVRDDGVGLRQPSQHGAGRGIGLTNLRERLRTLYGDGNHVRLISDEPGTVAELIIPARQAVPTSAKPEATEPDEDRLIAIDPSRSERRSSLPWIGLTWLLCGALWSQQSLVYLRIRQRSPDSLLSIVRNDMTAAALWAGFTIAVFAITARFPLVPRRSWLRVAAYAVGSAVVAALHFVLLRALTRSGIPLVSQTATFAFALNLLLVWTLVALGHRRRLLDWLRERELAAARLTSALSQARNRAAEIRADPVVLVTTLETLSELVVSNPAATERVLVYLADYLRASLDVEGEFGNHEARDGALVRLRAELHDSGLHQAHVA